MLKDDMSFKDFKTMARRLGSPDVRTLDIVDGEPTIHKDIFSISEKFAKKSPKML